MGTDAKLYSTKKNTSCDVDRKHNFLVHEDCPEQWDSIYQYATGAPPAAFIELVKHQLSVLHDERNLNAYRLLLALMFLETLDADDVVHLYDEHHKEEEYYWNHSGKIVEFGDRLPYDVVA